jgi:hypothetical protein
MPIVRSLVVLAIVLSVVGIVSIFQAEQIPEFTPEGRPLYELLDRGLSGPWPGGNNAWRKEVDARRTERDPLFDRGGALISIAVAVLTLAWNMTTNKASKRPRTPSSRWTLAALFLIFYAASFYAAWLTVHLEYERQIDPPWVDNLRIQGISIVFGFPLLLLPAALVFLLPAVRSIDLPQDLLLWRRSHPIASGAALLFYDGLAALLLLLVVLSSADAGFIGILPLLGFAYLAICAQAMVLAPERDKGRSKAPAPETQP